MESLRHGFEEPGDEQDIRLVVDTIPTLAWSAGPDGSADFFNQRWLDYTGLSAKQALGWGWEVAIHPDDLPRILETFREALNSVKPYEVEGRFRRFDGEFRWFLFRASPLCDESGKVVKWYGTNTDIEDRKRAEDALRSHEQNLRLLVDTIPGHIVTTTPTGEIELLNRRVLEYFDKTPEELVNWRTSDAIHPDDLALTIAAWTRAIQTGEPYESEHRLRRADGAYRWFHTRGLALRDKEGRIVRWYLFQIDVDDRRRAEEALRKSEERWRSVFENSAIVVALTDLNGRFLATNHVFQAMVGYTEEELRAVSFADLTHEDYRQANWALVTELVEGKRRQFQIEKKYRRKDGSSIWVSNNVSLVPGTERVPRFIMALSEDITQRKRAEEALRSHEQNLRLLVDTIPGFVVTTTPAGEIELLNRQILEYLDKTPEEVANWRTSDAGHPDDLPLTVAALTRAIQTGEPYEVEHRLRRADGAYRWFHTRGLALRDKEGRIVRWYYLPIDVDDRRRAEEALRKSEALLHNENVVLREQIDQAFMFEEIVGTSSALQEVLSRIVKVAPTDSSVLVSGESGTGKELVARAIHKRSRRSQRAFVSVNCAALAPSLISSELFGHEKGAFTGAMQRRLGQFELANGGTIFLDEIGELPLDTQVALLRVLQEREFERVGGTQPVKVDVRVIAATNRDLG